ncbi:MAG: hypothetical protein ACR2L2_03505 [Acidobacteriota bacterium]
MTARKSSRKNQPHKAAPRGGRRGEEKAPRAFQWWVGADPPSNPRTAVDFPGRKGTRK